MGLLSWTPSNYALYRTSLCLLSLFGVASGLYGQFTNLSLLQLFQIAQTFLSVCSLFCIVRFVLDTLHSCIERQKCFALLPDYLQQIDRNLRNNDGFMIDVRIETLKALTLTCIVIGCSMYLIPMIYGRTLLIFFMCTKLISHFLYLTIALFICQFTSCLKARYDFLGKTLKDLYWRTGLTSEPERMTNDIEIKIIYKQLYFTASNFNFAFGRILFSMFCVGYQTFLHAVAYMLVRLHFVEYNLQLTIILLPILLMVRFFTCLIYFFDNIVVSSYQKLTSPSLFEMEYSITDYNFHISH